MTLPNFSTYFESNDIDQQLSFLDLDVAVLRDAALQGLSAWASCTANHPPTYPGTVQWAEGTRALRESLLTRGWSRKNEANLPLVVNAKGTIAIAIASGDAQTGKSEGFPGTRSAKGPKTVEAIRANRQQLHFEFMDIEPVLASINTPGRSTWLFLTYRDSSLKQLRCELSQPVSITAEGQVNGFAKRIILPVVPFGEDLRLDDIAKVTQSPEITVEIKQLG